MQIERVAADNGASDAGDEDKARKKSREPGGLRRQLLASVGDRNGCQCDPAHE